MRKEREYWVDYVKAIACLLVVLGHFYQSMVKAEIIMDVLALYWFNRAIYCFHVQLFFICSGYLFQRYSNVRSISEWGNNILKKLIVLGVPYVVFTLATWVLKTAFSSSVNNKVGSLFYVLFTEPIPPYWYLYTLFFIFVFTITAKQKLEMYILLVVSLILKLISVFELKTGVYFIDETMKHWLWFVLGMAFSMGIIKALNIRTCILFGALFLFFSLIYSIKSDEVEFIKFLLGLPACYAIISVFSTKCNRNDCRILNYLKKYTMPIFLMHTLFAATVRAALMKIDVTNRIVHITLGLTAAILGPIIAMKIMELLKPMDFIIYPSRYLGKKKGD